MPDLTKLDHLVEVLRSRIFTPDDTAIDLVWAEALPEQRAEMVAGPHDDWAGVTPNTVWGAPQSYFWFAGQATIPAALEGKRVYLGIEAQFGRVMGRSDPQCLVRINGRIVQGADFNHREVLLAESARAGEVFDILIEAGTIEDRRQLGFCCRLLAHDKLAEALYYDLRVPLDVARHLPETDHRRDLILNTVHEALGVLDLRPGHPERFARSIDRALVIAARIYETSDTEAAPKITVTGHTHIDVAWLWRVRETRQKMARSMATALALLDAYPEYRFMYNQGVLLDYLSEDYPDLFARIVEKQRNGTFEIEGALWLEPDANMIGGEALVRQILKGVRYHEEKFDVRPMVLWLPDTFGYSAALPQIMKLAGLTVFVTHKLSWNDTNRMPNETFFWQGIDGTRAPTYFLTTQPADSESIGTTYCPDLKASHVMGTWRRYAQKATNDELFLVYGFGDGGGGPTSEMLEHIRRMERGIPGCPRVSQGFMGPFFERLTARMNAAPDAWPVWVGELYLEFHRGTFTSVAPVKRNNRRAEAMMRELEMLASLCWARGACAYPDGALAELWDIVLLNQFHDILPGSSIGLVYEDSEWEFAAFFTEAEGLRQKLVTALAGDGFVAANPLGRDRGGLVETDTPTPVRIAGMPSQTLVHADGSTAQAAPVSPVPAFGVARIEIAPGSAALPGDGLAVSTTHLENSRLEARFDDKGRLLSVFDKLLGREALSAGTLGNHLRAYRDLPREFDAWDIDTTFEDQFWDIDDLVSAEVVERGPYREAIRFEWRYESSRLVQVVSLEAEADMLCFDTWVDWREHNTLVKAIFPLALRTAESRAEIQFGHVTRPTHANTSWDQARYEYPMQRWVDLGEPGFGVAFLNDCKYGYDAKGTTVRLTLLRSPTWPWPEADQGEHRFRYAMMLHHGGDMAVVSEAAERFNHPMTLVAATGDATGADLSGLVRADNPAIAVEAIKRAEDGDDLIVRLWERSGGRQASSVRFAPEIAAVAETDLLERESAMLGMDGQEIRLDFAPFEIKTLRLVLPRRRMEPVG